MVVHTETSTFARKALVQPDLWRLGAPDGLARMNELRNGSTRFSLDRIKKTWHTFADGKRQQSEGEVAFKANASGQTGDSKISCLNTSGVPILLSAPEFVAGESRH